MTNIVLKSLRVKNFGPFADEVVFTTATDRAKKEFMENTFSYGEEVFNRVSYIFGANGAGKSNFCKAIIHIQQLINLSPLLASNNPQLLELQPIKLSTNEMDKHFIFDKNMLNAIRINELLNGLKIPPKDEGEENDEV